MQEKLEEREEEIQRLKHEPQEKKTIVKEQNVLATDIVDADVDVDVDVNAVTPIEVETEN